MHTFTIFLITILILSIQASDIQETIDCIKKYIDNF